MLIVALAGPILAAEASGTALDPWQILLNLIWIMAVPLAPSVVIRASFEPPEVISRFAATTSPLSMAALVAMVAAEVHFTRTYLAILAAIGVF